MVSNELIISAILIILSAIIGHVFTSFRWIRYSLSFGGALLGLLIIPNKSYHNLEHVFSYQYLFITFTIIIFIIYSMLIDNYRRFPSTKIKPYKRSKFEKFHTVNGITFKYNSSDGKLDSSPHCSKDRIPLECVVFKDQFMNDTFFFYICPICREKLSIKEVELDKLIKFFKTTVKSYVNGHLKQLPLNLQL